MMKKKKVEINPETILRRDPEQEFTYIDGEVVMLSLKNGEYYGLDLIGTCIWEMLAEKRKFLNLIFQLMNEFEVEKNKCITDTKDFLFSLLEKDLIEFEE